MANLSPATPSALYDVQPVSVAILYVELKGNKYLTVQGAKAFARRDIPGYDGGNQRDIIDANKLGRAGTGIMKVNDSTFTEVDYPGTSTNSPTLGVDFVVEVLEDTIVAPIPDQAFTMMSQDDEFMHVPPRNELKTRSVMLWFDGITAGMPPTVPSTANIVGRCWADRYEGEGTQIPQTNGSVPPQFSTP